MNQLPREDRDWYMVIQDDLRPAGNHKDCFFCGIPLGGKHKEGCVIRRGAGFYHVAIRENATGEVRIYRNDMSWDESDEYYWLDGNGSCDCNRHLFFLRAGGPGPEDDPYWNNADIVCGDSAYSVLYVELPNGERYLASADS